MPSFKPPTTTLSPLALRHHILRPPPSILGRTTPPTPTKGPFFKQPPRTPSKRSYTTTPSPPHPPKNDPSAAPSLSILPQVLALPRPLRYTIFSAFFLAALAESTFWVNLMYYKFFATNEEERERGREFAARLEEAVGNARGAWLGKYGEWFGRGVWGV